MRVEGWQISMHYYLHLLQIMVCTYGIGQIFSCSNYFHALPKLLFLIGTARTALMRMKLYRWCRQIFCLLVSVQM